MSTLKEALARLTVDDLKALLRCLSDMAPTGRKDDLVKKLHQSLDGAGLRALWNRLDDMQRLAVAETLYAVDGVFHPDQFRAKYGQLPDFSVKDLAVVIFIIGSQRLWPCCCTTRKDIPACLLTLTSS